MNKGVLDPYREREAAMKVPSLMKATATALDDKFRQAKAYILASQKKQDLLRQ